MFDWNAVGAIGTCAGVLFGILGVLARWIVKEVRKTGSVIDDVNRRVTTPDTVPGTVGETVAKLSLDSDTHVASDDVRFAHLWNELGKPEPGR